MSHMTRNINLSLTAILALAFTGSAFAQDEEVKFWSQQKGTQYGDIINSSARTTGVPLLPDPNNEGEFLDPPVGTYIGTQLVFGGYSFGILPNYTETIPDDFEQTRTNKDGMLISYKPDGTINWNTRIAGYEYTNQFSEHAENLNKSDSSSELITSVTNDNFGGVIVTGYTTGMIIDGNKKVIPGGDSSSYDQFTVNIDHLGQIKWANQETTGEDTRAVSVITDSNNNIFVAGYTRDYVGDPLATQNTNLGGNDGYITKFQVNNSTGEKTVDWTKQFGTAANDFVTDIKSDDLGNLYVTGTTYAYIGDEELGVNKGSYDTYIKKFGADGEELWSKQYGSSFNDQVAAIELHKDENDDINIYVTGHTYNIDEWDVPPTVLWDEGDADIYVQKVDEHGSTIWNTSFSTEKTDRATDIHIDDEGNIYITGYTLGTYLGTYYGEEDAIVIKLNEHGDFEEGVQFVGARDQRFNTVVTDEDGEIYLGGSTDEAMFEEHQGADDFIVTKLFDLPVILGDTNYDGMVDETDLENIINNFGGFGYDADGVLGKINLADLFAVRNNFGFGVTPGPASIPEPASLLTLSALATLALRRRKNT